MNLNLKGKRAVITGASNGIGNGIAKVLANLGVLCLISARRSELLEKTKEEIERNGGIAPIPFAVDLFEQGAPKKLAHKALEVLGEVDILVNSAGRSKAPAAPRNTPFNHPSELWEKELHLNYVVLRELTFLLLPQMQKRKYGRIINITGKSEPEKLGTANPPKAAVHAWAKGLSRMIAQDGVTINQISPGKIISEQILANYSAVERQKYESEDIPLGYFGFPEDLGNLVAFLSSSQAEYITGTVIPVDGGFRKFAF
jgi:3-oxoacyl-[acyl-carrier protein] reductase